MGQKTLLGLVALVVFLILLFVFVITKGSKPSTKPQTSTTGTTASDLVDLNKLNKDSLVYVGETVETQGTINDWINKKSFTVTTGGGAFGGGSAELPVIADKNFTLNQSVNGLKLGETVNVILKGRMTIMDRNQLGASMGIDLDGSDASLDDNSIIRSWQRGSVMVLESATKE